MKNTNVNLDKLSKAMPRVAPNEILKLIKLRDVAIVNELNETNNNNIDMKWQHIESALHMSYRIAEDYERDMNIDELKIKCMKGFKFRSLTDGEKKNKITKIYWRCCL